MDTFVETVTAMKTAHMETVDAHMETVNAHMETVNARLQTRSTRLSERTLFRHHRIAPDWSLESPLDPDWHTCVFYF
jgi:hypothetical protein